MMDLILAYKDGSLKKFMEENIYNYIDMEVISSQHKNKDKIAGIVSIENRPPHCDRGRYLVKVFSNCPIELYVDSQDMFPRYYFDFNNMISELFYWFSARKLNVVLIEKKKYKSLQYIIIKFALDCFLL
jgi:hypothetical protein